MDILLGESTKREFDQFLMRPSHAIGIFAELGCGKKYTAAYIATQLLKTTSIDNNSEVYIVRPNEKGSIVIDDIRGVTAFLKLRPVTRKEVARVVLIEDADAMTTEAQNAILKTLEEPPKDCVLILTVSSQSRLLPTISSRLKSIHLKPPGRQRVLDHFASDYSKTEIEKAWLISSGRVGLMTSLLAQKDHPVLPFLETAKRVITNSKHERLLMVDALTKQDVSQILQGMMIVSTTAFKGAVNKGNTKQIAQWHTIRSTVYEYSQMLRYNPNTKLLLTDLMLQL